MNSSSKDSAVPNTAPSAGRPPICSAPATLPDPLARTALAWASDRQTEPADIRDLRCTLEHHVTGDHYAMVHDATATTAIWTRWTHDGDPRVLLVLPDCPATDPVHGGCCEYESHPGGHTWQVHDPWDSHHEAEEGAANHVRQAPDRRNERCPTT